MGFFSPLHNLNSYSVELKEHKGLQHSRAHFPAQLNPHKKEHTGSSRVVQMPLKDSVRGTIWRSIYVPWSYCKAQPTSGKLTWEIMNNVHHQGS